MGRQPYRSLSAAISDIRKKAKKEEDEDRRECRVKRSATSTTQAIAKRAGRRYLGGTHAHGLICGSGHRSEYVWIPDFGSRHRSRFRLHPSEPDLYESQRNHRKSAEESLKGLGKGCPYAPGCRSKGEEVSLRPPVN